MLLIPALHGAFIWQNRNRPDQMVVIFIRKSLFLYLAWFDLISSVEREARYLKKKDEGRWNCWYMLECEVPALGWVILLLIWEMEYDGDDDNSSRKVELLWCFQRPSPSPLQNISRERGMEEKKRITTFLTWSNDCRPFCAFEFEEKKNTIHLSVPR